MATYATNDIESPKDDLVDAEKPDKPTTIGQNGESVQGPTSEQGFENNTNSTHIESQTDNIDNSARNLEEENVEISSNYGQPKPLNTTKETNKTLD